MCIVENVKTGKIDASCSMEPKDGLEIRTNTARLLRHRRMILELMLASHDCSCTTCAKSGNCRLQALAQRFGVSRVRFPDTRERYEQDNTSLAIFRDPNKCILCGDCVRVCEELQGQGILNYAHRGSELQVMPAFDKKLDQTKCVGCGQCAAVCTTGAITVKNQIGQAWQALHDPRNRVVVQIAPAVRVALGEEFGLPAGENVMDRLVKALKLMGVEEVYDTDFAADMTTISESQEFLERLKAGGPFPMFTSCCPAWVKYLELNDPKYLHNISSCKSPMEMFAAVLRDKYQAKDAADGRRTYHMAIMPCTGKKFEAARPELEKDGERLIDLVITTSELCDMIEEAGIDFAHLPDEEPDAPLGDYTGAGVIFGVTGGVTEAVIRRVLDDASPNTLQTIAECGVRGLEGIKAFTVTAGDLTIRIAVANGLANADKLIAKVESGEEQFDFIEVMACPNGCIGGGGQPPACNKRKAERAEAIFKADEACALRIPQQNPDLGYVYDTLLQGRAHELLHIHYPAHGQHS